MDEFELQHKIQNETARRLDLITATPGAVLKYDRDGDGQLDDEEWQLMRALVEAEVVRDLSDAPTTDERTDGTLEEETDEWTIEEETADPHIDLPVLEVVDKRYEVLKEIGRGSQGQTYLGRARQTGDYVALKELSFSALDSWKSLELFEREVAVLRGLDHPAIPDFVDSFHVEVAGESRFFLVQEFVSGDSLDVVIARGERFSERDLETFIRQMLGVLDYLHTLNPPIIHRDVKPSNIIRSQDGRYSLVDFGGVQMVMPDEVGGSTVIGTTGYMPPEQLTGRACPQSDLYGLGATLVHLVTHVRPSELPQKRLKLDWRDRANTSDKIANFIDRLIEPVVEDRPKSAADAEKFVRGRPAPTALARVSQPKPVPSRPSGTALVPMAGPEHNPALTKPRGATARIDRQGAILRVAMRRPIGNLEMEIGGLLTIAVVALSLVTGTMAPVLLAVFVAALYAFGRSGEGEKLVLHPNGRFSFERKQEKSRHTSTGRAIAAEARDDHIALITDVGTELKCAENLDEKTIDWVVQEINLYLDDLPRDEADTKLLE